MSSLQRATATHSIAISSLLVGAALSFWGGPGRPVWVWVIVVILVAIAIGSAFFDIHNTKRDEPRKFHGKTKNADIRDYMNGIFESEGRCVVCSNDLSWATEREIDTLARKAERKSLTLIMPKENERSAELVSKGATAHYYNNDKAQGKGARSRLVESSFTLINAERSDAWLAIGHGGKDEHTIREVTDPSDPVLFLAKDLARLAARADRQ